MRLQDYQTVDYIPAQTALVLTREELDRMVDEAKTAEDFSARLKDAFDSIPYTPGYHGDRRKGVWLEGVSESDPIRKSVGVFVARLTKDQKEGADYIRQGKGFFVRVRSHGCIG